MRLRLVLASVLLCTGCASALQPVGAKVVTGGPAETPETVYADLRKLLRELEAEPSAGRREQLAVQAVQLGQRCDQIASGNALCDYGLALALGVQAREKPSTAHDGLGIMAKRLERAAATDPSLDHAGPERVWGLLLARAPGWPTGPGDPETGLKLARKAAQREPSYAPNWLAVAEAADANGDDAGRREAAQTAEQLATQAQATGEPKAADWRRDAQKLLSK